MNHYCRAFCSCVFVHLVSANSLPFQEKIEEPSHVGFMPMYLCRVQDNEELYFLLFRRFADAIT